LFVLHLALGGCLKSPPISYGETADTGGHIAYVLEAASAQARQSCVESVSVVTRRFRDARLGPAYAVRSERLSRNLSIDRISSRSTQYLEKAALAAELPSFTAAFCAHLAALPRFPDVIHAHFADAASVASTARSLFGIPFVYTPHSLGIDKRAHGPGGDAIARRIACERRAIGQADAIVVSSRDEAERQVRAYRVADAASRTFAVSPGVPRLNDSAGAAAGRVDLGAWLDEPDKPMVLAIARPVRKKNLPMLTRAFAASPSLMAHANLVILAGQHGGGSASGEEAGIVAELDLLCRSTALRGRMALPPRHDAADVASLYRQAASGGVFVNAALHEPFGLTTIEAAAAGVPVVATRNGGPSDIVETLGNGLLVDPTDQEAIAAACLRVVSDGALHAAFSRSGLDRVGRYSWSRYAQRTVSLYGALTGSPETASPAPRRIAPGVVCGAQPARV
jgi:sucrose-phosphate synthase